MALDVGSRGGTLTGAPARFAKGLLELDAGAWAWLQPNGGWGEANAGLILGDGEALIVDTLWDERLATEMLGAMTPVLADRSVRYVVNTHSDGDHWWGNGAMPTAAQVITSERSRSAMDDEVAPSALARTGTLARLGARLPGPLHALNGYVGEMLAPFDFGGVRLRYPDRTFSTRQALEVGGRNVELIEVGPAHTPGDAIVHLADAGVVFAADILFVGTTPVMWFGPLEGWLKAIDRLLSLDARCYVPGHGPPGDRAAVQEMRDYMSWVGAAAREQHAKGRSPLKAARVILDADEYVRWREWECPERILITITTIHRALNGRGPLGVSPRVRTRLFSQVAALQHELGAGSA